MPDELRQQFPVIEEVVKVFKIPIFHVEGYEADDCLATLTQAAEKEAFLQEYTAAIWICSSLLQKIRKL
jgi:5'-3' exonuclease